MHGAGRQRAALAHGFIPLRAKRLTEGPEPKDLSIGTASRRQNRIHEASCCTDTKAQKLLGKARCGPPTPRGPHTRDPKGKLPLPNQVVVARYQSQRTSQREGINQLREAARRAARGPLRWRGGRPGTCPCHGTPETLAARAQGSPEAARCKGVK